MQIAYHLPSNSCPARVEPRQFALWQQLQQVCYRPDLRFCTAAQGLHDTGMPALPAILAKNLTGCI